MHFDLPGYRCPLDGTCAPAAALLWRCPRCGSPWDLDYAPDPVDPSRLGGRQASMWRYREALPLPEPASSLGEGFTALVQLDHRVRAKLDFLLPTLSFKDRGAAVLVEAARRLDPARMLADSSGNAGTAIAAYAARAGLPCEVFVPQATSQGKLAQLRAHGATVRAVPGDREATAQAARAAADTAGTFYASHVYNPYFLHGTKTYGYEVWEQSGRRFPDVLALPVGNGTLLLGAALAARELLAAGLIDRLPVLVGVQTAAMAPLAAASAGESDRDPAEAAGAAAPRDGEGAAAPGAGEGAAAPRDGEGAASPGDRGRVTEGVAPHAELAAAGAAPTVAEGIAIANPPRAAQILAEVRRSGGGIVTVPEAQIVAAQVDLARRGLFVEPTAAVCWAACRPDAAVLGEPARTRQLRSLLTEAELVLPLCGAGAKTGLPHPADAPHR